MTTFWSVSGSALRLLFGFGAFHALGINVNFSLTECSGSKIRFFGAPRSEADGVFPSAVLLDPRGFLSSEPLATVGRLYFCGCPGTPWQRRALLCLSYQFSLSAGPRLVLELIRRH